MGLRQGIIIGGAATVQVAHIGTCSECGEDGKGLRVTFDSLVDRDKWILQHALVANGQHQATPTTEIRIQHL